MGNASGIRFVRIREAGGRNVNVIEGLLISTIKNKGQDITRNKGYI